MDRSKASLQASANGYYDHITTAVLPTLAELINTLTGYSHVQECKNRVLQKDADLNAARERSDASKRLYEQTIDERRKCQRELNSLLQRKDSWLDSDITRFTELYRKDLNLEQSENQARNEHQAATEAFDRCHREYLNEIRERYIEEQLYSDKIRRASTWWTWGLISLHFALFVVIQLFVEPRKRRILKEELSALITNTSATDVKDVEGAIGAQLAPLTQRLAAIESAVAQPTSSHFSTPLLPYAEPEPQTVGTSSKVESASSIHRKDMLFVRGFLMGTAVGIGSMALYLYSG
ncbi:sensitivity to high expression protein she9 [Gaertneriomyces sp. JEL0708]|nr:sensitivity to high expression protein she9 [Gaertneriomyces sp. JEL0708]